MAEKKGQGNEDLPMKHGEKSGVVDLLLTGSKVKSERQNRPQEEILQEMLEEINQKGQEDAHHWVKWIKTALKMLKKSKK